MKRCLLVSVFLPSIAFCQSAEPQVLRERASALIETSLHDKNPETRTHAVESLGLVSATDPYLTELEAMLQDKDVGVRLATILSLMDLKSERTIPALRMALASDVPEVSFAAAKALWSLNDSLGRDALLSVLGRETKSASGFITKEKREGLRMLHTPRTTFMFALVESAHFAPVPGVGAGVSSLAGILSNPGVSGRAASALLLSTDQGPEVLQALEDALADTDWSVRAAAVHAIAVRNDPALEDHLIPLLEDKKEAVRVRAAAGYLRLEAIRVSAASLSAAKK